MAVSYLWFQRQTSLIMHSLENWCPFPVPTNQTNIIELEQKQRDSSKKVSGIENKNYWERLRTSEIIIIIYVLKTLCMFLPNQGSTIERQRRWYSPSDQFVMHTASRIQAILIPFKLSKTSLRCKNYSISQLLQNYLRNIISHGFLWTIKPEREKTCSIIHPKQYRETMIEYKTYT